MIVSELPVDKIETGDRIDLYEGRRRVTMLFVCNSEERGEGRQQAMAVERDTGRGWYLGPLRWADTIRLGVELGIVFVFGGADNGLLTITPDQAFLYKTDGQTFYELLSSRHRASAPV